MSIDLFYTAIYLKSDFFYFLVLRFCATFDILFSMSDSTRNDHKTNLCNFWGVRCYIDPTNMCSTSISCRFSGIPQLSFFPLFKGTRINKEGAWTGSFPAMRPISKLNLPSVALQSQGKHCSDRIHEPACGFRMDSILKTMYLITYYPPAHVLYIHIHDLCYDMAGG